MQHEGEEYSLLGPREAKRIATRRSNEERWSKYEDWRKEGI
jgi:hypothetical protein